MIDDFLTELASHLHTSPRATARIVEEARDHLVDSGARYERDGLPPEIAQARAAAAFGDPALVAGEFNAQAETATMRRTPAAILGFAVIVIGGFLAAVVPVVTPPHPTSASIVLRIVYFIGIVGTQVAFVAGARALSIVAARWGDAIAPARERSAVRSAAVIGIGGLVLAATAWAVSIALVLASAQLSGNRSLVAGVVGLALAAGCGVVVVVRFAREARSTPSTSVAAAVAAPPSGIGAIGERIVGLVLRFPRVACTIVAVAAGLATMRGAESTPLGALPKGLAEVAIVIGAFVVLGPRLGLRGAARARA